MKYLNLLSLTSDKRMAAIYEEGVYVGDRRPKGKIVLNSNKISSIELRKSWTSVCILEVCMDSGRSYVRKGNCEELQETFDLLGKEIQFKYPTLYTFHE